MQARSNLCRTRQAPQHGMPPANPAQSAANACQQKLSRVQLALADASRLFAVTDRQAQWRPHVCWWCTTNGLLLTSVHVVTEPFAPVPAVTQCLFTDEVQRCLAASSSSWGSWNLQRSRPLRITCRLRSDMPTSTPQHRTTCPSTYVHCAGVPAHTGTL